MRTNPLRQIWPMSARNKNNQVKITERYLFEDLPQIEGGRNPVLIKVFRAMEENLETGEITIDGRPVYVAYNANCFDLPGAGQAIYNVYTGAQRTQVPTRFDWSHWSKYLTMAKQLTKLKSEYMTDAWLEHEYGVFWTWQKINIKDIALNIRKYLEFVDLPEDQRRSQLTRVPGRVTLDMALGGLKSHLERQAKDRSGS